MPPSSLAFSFSWHQDLFWWVGSSHQVAKILELSFRISSSSEYSGLISFMIDRFDLLAVKASILQCLAFFMVHLSHPYMTTGKTIALTIQTFVSKVMSLLFNTVSRFVIAFLPRIRHLLISRLQTLPSVILEPKKIKSATASTFPPSICHEVMELDAMALMFWMLSFKLAFLLSSFTLFKKLFSSFLFSSVRVIPSPYLRFFIFLPAILIPAQQFGVGLSGKMFWGSEILKWDSFPPIH